MFSPGWLTQLNQLWAGKGVRLLSCAGLRPGRWGSAWRVCAGTGGAA